MGNHLTWFLHFDFPTSHAFSKTLDGVGHLLFFRILFFWCAHRVQRPKMRYLYPTFEAKFWEIECKTGHPNRCTFLVKENPSLWQIRKNFFYFPTWQMVTNLVYVRFFMSCPHMTENRYPQFSSLPLLCHCILPSEIDNFLLIENTLRFWWNFSWIILFKWD